MDYNQAVSKAEERFEKLRKTVGLVLGPAVFLLLYLLPLEGLTPEAKKLSAILGIVLVFWLTEAAPIPVTALLGAALCVLFNVAPAQEVLAPFANPIVFLFIGSLMLAEAISAHGLDKRFAFAIFSFRFLQRSPARALFAVGAITAGISMWISNTAAAAMIFPVALGALGGMKEMRRDGFDFKRYSTAMMLMVAYGASVGGLATPIGTPPNLIGIGMIERFTGVRISFFEWMVFALPMTMVMFFYLFFILGVSKSFGRLELSGVDAYVKKAREKLGAWNRGEKNTALCFAVAIILWILPSVFELSLGKEAAFPRFLSGRLNEGVVALVAALLLFFLPVSFKDRVFTLSWERAVKIDWGTILLFGGGLSLGGLMFSTGLAGKIGSTLTMLTGATTLWTITSIAIALGITLSETTSNTASANMAIPVMIALANGAGVSPLPPALGACLGASFGFMLPVSTPPNAIVYASGLVPITSMVKKGILFDVGGFFVILFWLMLACPLMGWS
ncbi:MAG: DASS family sodium-coupled anion symporter [Deltaproteobacteria bacterium]|nr:DASS family sodium-coupled anion symporter [Deltaproteobacteria bacterium]